MTIHRGSLIAATWLIGLGLVFLIREAAGLDWGEAWPLFVILVGVAGFVGRVAHGARGVAGIWSFTWPVLWIAIGAVLLLSTTGALGRPPIDLVADGWPWLLVAVGGWFLVGAFVPFGAEPNERVTIPLAGVTEGVIRVRFG